MPPLVNNFLGFRASLSADVRRDEWHVVLADDDPTVAAVLAHAELLAWMDAVCLELDVTEIEPARPRALVEVSRKLEATGILGLIHCMILGLRAAGPAGS